MAKFKIKNIKVMTPRPGVKYSTKYYQQTQTDYDKTWNHIADVIKTVYRHAEKHDLFDELNEPRKGFPRTGGKGNYTTNDIFADLCEQYIHNKDWPSGMVDRWNRMFDGNPDLQLEFDTDIGMKSNYNNLFR